MPINPQSYQVLFLSEEALKKASVINSNVDMQMLTPIIQMVQDIFLTKILGTGLLVDLQDKVYNTINNLSGSTLSVNDKFLLDAYITPLMVWLVMGEAAVFMTYKYMNKGVQTQNSDNSQPVSDSEIQLLVNKAKRSSDWYTQRLINYLIANTSLYPAYMRSTTYDDVIPTQKGYKSSIYLGKVGYTGTGPRGAWDCPDCDWAKYFR